MTFGFSSNSKLAWKVFALEVSEIRTGRTGLLVMPLGERAPEGAGRLRPAGVSGGCAFHRLRIALILFTPFPLVAHVQVGVGTISGLMSLSGQIHPHLEAERAFLAGTT